MEILMMLRRSLLVAAASIAVACLAAEAGAQTWAKQYPELVFAVVPAENASGVTERYAPFIDHLSKELGTKITLRIANDYAAVIEGQRAGNVHLGFHGPASYSRAILNGVKIEPFTTTVNADGSIGYYSVFYVKADSPYQKIEDLKGKNLGLVDPNSTSGNNVPRFALNKMKIEPDAFFGKVVYAGSHENAVIALNQGTVDVATNWWNSDDDSNLTRMVNKGLVKKENFRIVFKSDMIANSPYTYLSSLPAELRAAIQKAFVESPVKAKAAFDKLSDGKDREFTKVDHSFYASTVELIKFVDSLRKKSS
jgi:phosphonate transport system substrate-binding protein